jgi:hypothetical protein
LTISQIASRSLSVIIQLHVRVKDAARSAQCEGFSAAPSWPSYGLSDNFQDLLVHSRTAFPTALTSKGLSATGQKVALNYRKLSSLLPNP